ncbi:hypothetical protein BDQ17DRAFT_444262 [Cyathus striatus]|nr:hypothetical protein BDQ17DRAFT_444262 [Cyathus striatus]
MLRLCAGSSCSRRRLWHLLGLLHSLLRLPTRDIRRHLPHKCLPNLLLPYLPLTPTLRKHLHPPLLLHPRIRNPHNNDRHRGLITHRRRRIHAPPRPIRTSFQRILLIFYRQLLIRHAAPQRLPCAFHHPTKGNERVGKFLSARRTRGIDRTFSNTCCPSSSDQTYTGCGRGGSSYTPPLRRLTSCPRDATPSGTLDFRFLGASSGRGANLTFRFWCGVYRDEHDAVEFDAAVGRMFLMIRGRRWMGWRGTREG